VEPRTIRVLTLQRLEVEIEREIAFDARQIARQERLVAIFLERLLLRCTLDLIEILIDAFQ
jgi:hypothetical protein